MALEEGASARRELPIESHGVGSGSDLLILGQWLRMLLWRIHPAV